MKKLAMTLLVFGMALAASGVCAQNLLDNPDFDIDLASWSCGTANGAAVRDSRDVDGALGSGSLQIDNDAPSVGAKVSCVQCVPVVEEVSYRLASWVYFADEGAFTLDGSARTQLMFSDDAGCVNSVGFGDIGYLEANPGNADTWVPLTTGWNLAPSGATHAAAYLISWANIQDNPTRMHYDAVWQTDEVIFADDFESGDTSAWSSTIPPPCAEEGGTITLGPTAPPCCPGLDQIADAYYDGQQCVVNPGTALCTFCGDGDCGLGENLCNCPSDC